MPTINYGLLADSQSKMIDFKPPEGFAYELRKWGSIVICSFVYMIGYFHRFTTAVLSEQLAKDFNVDVSDLGIMTSLFFYPYGFSQPFVGALADIIDSGYMIGAACLIASVGTAICAISKVLWLEFVGKFFVGLGCGAIFVPANKVAANWFTPTEYRYFCGALVGIGGIGAVLSQKPLQALGEIISWRIILWITTGITLVLALLSFVFIRAHPITLGYQCDVPRAQPQSFRESMHTLVHEIWTMCKMSQFWLLFAWMFFAPGCSFVVSSLWGVPYLTDVYGYSTGKASYVQMAISVAIIIGAPLFPYVATLIKSRRWTLFMCSIIGAVASLCLAFIKNMEMWQLIILYFFFNLGASAGQATAIPIFKEMADPKMSATMVGGGNTGPFVGAAILQTISSSIIKHYGPAPYPFVGYQVALWGFCAVCCVLGAIVLFWVKKSPVEIAMMVTKEDADESYATGEEGLYGE